MKTKLIWLIAFIIFFKSISFAQNEIITYPNQFDIKYLQSLETSKKAGWEGSGDEKSYTVFLKHSKPNEIVATLKTIFPEYLLAADERTRAVIIKANPQDYKKILKLTEELDRKLPQIKIEVQIIELNYADLDQYQSIFESLTDGFKINYDFTKGKLTAPDGFKSVILSLVQKGQARVLAKPTLSMLDNNLASIKVGDKVPYVTTIIDNQNKATQVNFVDTGIELKILPKVASKNIICAEIEAVISSVKLWKEFQDYSYPVLSTRRTMTRVNIENKKTLVLAGLLDEQERTNQKGLPILSDIFLIGNLFKSQSTEKVKSDIVFLITPEIFE